MVDSTQAERGVTTLKNNLVQLGAGTTQVQGKMAAFNAQLKQQATSFAAGVTPIKQQGNALMNLNTQLKTTQTTSTTLGTKIKTTASNFAGFATGLSATTSGILSLNAGFRDYGDAQIAVDKATRKLSVSQEALTKAQDKLRVLQDKGIRGGKAYAQAQLDVKQAEQQLAIQTQLLGERQEDMFDSQTQFVASVIPVTLGAVGTLGSAFKDLGLNMTKIKSVFSGTGGGLTGLVDKFKGLGAGIAGTVMPALTNLGGGKGLGGLAEKFKGLGSTITGASGSIGGLSGGLTGLIGVLGPLALALGVAALAWESYNEAMANVAKGKKELELAKDAKLLTEQLNHLNKAFDDFKIDPSKGPAQFIASLGPAPGILNKVLDVMKADAVQTAKNAAESEKLTKAKKDLAAAEKNYQNAPRKDKEHAKDIRDNAAAEVQRLQVIEDAIPANQKYTASYKALQAEVVKTTSTWALQAHAFEGNTTSINLATKAYLDVHNAIVATNPDIQKNITNTRLQKQEIDAVAIALKNVKAAEDPASLLAYNNALKANTSFITLFGNRTDIAKEAMAKFNQKTSETSTGMTGFEGAIQAGVTQFQTLDDVTKNNVLQQKAYREQLVASVGKQVGFAKATAMTNSELELNVKAFLNDTEAIDALAHSTTDTSHAMNEQLVALLESKAASIDYAKALEDLDINQRLVAQGFEAGMIQAKDFFDNLVKGTEQEGVFNAALADGAKNLGIHSNLLAFSSGKMQELIKTTHEQSTAYAAEAMAASKSTAFLKDNALVMGQVHQGMIDGAKAANDWAISNIKATAEGFAFHDQLVKVTADMLGLPVPINATNEALQKAQKTFQETQDAGFALSEMMTDNLEPAFQRVSKIFQAKSFKDMKKALKDLELPKGFTHGLDDAFKGSQKAAESARKVGTAMDILVTKGTNFSKSDLSKNMKAFGNELDRMSKIHGTSKGVDEILMSLKTMSPQELGLHSKSMQFLVDTINEFGFLPTDKAKEFIDMFNKEGTKMGPSAETAAKGVDKLSSSFTALVTAGSAAAAQLAKAEAMFDPSKFTRQADTAKVNKVFKSTDKSLFNDKKTVINVDNHEALAAVDVVATRINDLGKIKPQISLMNNNAMSSIQTVAGEIDHLTKVKPEISLQNRNAFQAIEATSKEIEHLEKIKPQISLQNRNAFNAIDATGKEIDHLEKLKPQISLQNRNAFNAIDATGKEIDKLTKIKPQISLQNRNAISAIQTVESEIKKLGDLKPVIHVKVQVDGMPKGAAHGMHETLTQDTLIQAHKGERVDIQRSNLDDTSMRSLGASGNSIPPSGMGGMGMGMGNLTVNNVIDLGGDTIVRSFKRRLGTNLYTYGK